MNNGKNNDRNIKTDRLPAAASSGWRRGFFRPIKPLRNRYGVDRPTEYDPDLLFTAVIPINRIFIRR